MKLIPTQPSISGTARTLFTLCALGILAIWITRHFEKQHLLEWQLERDRWHEVQNHLITLKSQIQSGDKTSSREQLSRLKNLFDADRLMVNELEAMLKKPLPKNREGILLLLQQLRKSAHQNHKKKIGHYDAIFSIYDVFYLYVLCLILGSGCLLTWKFNRGLSQDINHFSQDIERIGNGDFDTPPQAAHFEEWAPVVEGFRIMQLQLKENRSRIRQKDRIEVLGTMSASMAHEICNPLGGIMGYAELLEDHVDEIGREDLAKLVHKVQDCRRIVDDLRLFSKGEETGRPLTQVKLRDIFEALHIDCLREFQMSFETHDQLDSISLNTHATSIKQILYNLCSNAFIAGAGEVHLRKGVSTHPNELVILIEDNGPGIDDKRKDHIFEPFFTTRETGKGTGLGLSICLGLARQNGGDLTLDSPRNPTRFRLVLPYSS